MKRKKPRRRWIALLLALCMVLSLVMPVSALDGQVQAERREGYDVATIHYTDGEGNERPLPRRLPATPIPCRRA